MSGPSGRVPKARKQILRHICTFQLFRAISIWVDAPKKNCHFCHGMGVYDNSNAIFVPLFIQTSRSKPARPPLLSTLNPERASTCCLPFFLLVLRPSSVQD